MKTEIASSLITVATFTAPLEAYIMKGRLEAENIPAFISNEHYISANWNLSLALGGVQLKVAAHLAEKALQIIADANNGKFDILDEDIKTPIQTCPYCYSTDISEKSHPGWTLAAFLSAGLFAVTFPPPHYHYCRRCKGKW